MPLVHYGLKVYTIVIVILYAEMEMKWYRA